MRTIETIYVGAGCFWGVQAYFDQVPGVIGTEVGYMGGHTSNPTYEEVCTHTTGHAEVVKVDYDTSRVAARDIIRHFFRMHDPTQLDGQGPDIGDDYRSAIFFTSPVQQQEAQSVVAAAQQNFKQPVVTEIIAAPTFYPAEAYHQKFFERTGHGACHVPYAPLSNG